MYQKPVGLNQQLLEISYGRKKPYIINNSALKNQILMLKKL